MAAITNYSTLVQALKDESENDGIEFSEFIPTAINLAEEKLFRELELPELEEDVSSNLVSGTNTLTKPLDYKFGDALRVKVGTTSVILKKKLSSYITDYWPDSTQTGVPKYYADRTATTFVLAPTPDSNYTYTLRCTKKPAKLTQSNTTNYFVLNCQDILFYATMLELVKFMKSWSQIPHWENVYRQAQESWNLQSMRYRRDGQIVPNSPDDGPNTMKHTIQTNS